jgi:hypothetical protein
MRLSPNDKSMKPGYVAFASVLTAVLLAAGGVGSGVVRINPGTAISTSGPGGLGIFAVDGGTVRANGIAIDVRVSIAGRIQF